MDTYKNFFNKDAWKAILFAFLILLVGQAVLTWQYYRLQEKQLPQIEEELEAQRLEIEERKAKELVEAFMVARLGGGNLEQYLTEGAAAQDIDDVTAIQGYDIEKTDVLGNETFRFHIGIQDGSGFTISLELITVTKILNTYYIDSVVLGG
ncbi:MAG: hypothetical protein QF775_00280 [archaeon]|nr:hypothetical protein [archaeon]